MKEFDVEELSMMRGGRCLLLLVTCFGLASCGMFGGGGEAPTATESASKVLALDEASGQAALTERYADFTSDVDTDAEGRILKSSKRSQYENKELTTIGGDWAGKQYVAKRYSAEKWDGGKRFQGKNYDGDMQSRYQDSEWFLKKQANEAGSAANSAGKRYQTRGYNTEGAREANASSVGRPSDVETDIRREVYGEPLIIPQADYTEMSIEDTNRLLGR